MSDTKKDKEQLTGAQKVEGALNHFLSKYLKAGVVVLLVLVLALIALGIGTSVSKKRQEAQFNLIDQLQSSYQELAVMDSEDAAY